MWIKAFWGNKNLLNLSNLFNLLIDLLNAVSKSKPNGMFFTGNFLGFQNIKLDIKFSSIYRSLVMAQSLDTTFGNIVI